MNNNLFQSALRELQADFTNRTIIIGLVALGLLLGISGPFETYDLLTPIPRVLYWLVIVVLTFAAGSFVSTLIHRALDQMLKWVSTIISALAIGIVVSAVVIVVNLIVFGFFPQTWGEYFTQLGIVTLISAIVEFSALALQYGTPKAPQTGAPILNRLPFEKRGEVVSLSAEDHYVRVSTTKGAELVLIRLADAINEIGPTPGLQIHRSHWIATEHVEKVLRNGSRHEVMLSDGTTRPISRGFTEAARKAGLLPSKSGK